MFSYYIDLEKKREFVEKIKQGMEKLDEKNKEFIEMAFSRNKNNSYLNDFDDENFEEDELFSDELDEIEAELDEYDDDDDSDDDIYYGNYSVYLIKKNLQDKDIWILDDIFPKDIYPALDLMIGKELREVLILACKKIVQFPYTVGYYRKMVRSTNYKNHIDNMWSILEELIEQKILGLDIVTILKRDYDRGKYYKVLSSSQIFVEIDRNNKEVIEIIKDMLLSENNTNILTYEIFRGIFKSDNKEIVELTGKLLLAAKLQEGLRQAICENMDCGTQANFEYMFDIVYKNDLVRFSSVKRAIATFTGIGEQYSDRITKKQLELINSVLQDKKQADIYLKSDDNVEAMIGLWYKGSKDLSHLIKAMESIISKGKRHSILLVSYYLDLIQDKKYSNEIAKTVIKKFAKDEKTFEKNDAFEILACYLTSVTGMTNWYGIRRDLEENRIKLTDFFKDEKEAREFFDIFEYAINSMKQKEITYSPCIFPWYSTSISKESLASTLLITAIFVKSDMTDKAVDYIKYASTYYRSHIVEKLLENPQSKKQKDMVVEMLSDRTGASDTARKIIISHNMIDEYIDKIQDILRLKTPDIRKNAIDIIYSQEKDKLVKSISYLISQKDVNKRLAGLDIMLKAKTDKKIDIDTLNEIADTLSNPSSSEQILIEQLKDGKMQDELAKELYDINYEVDFDIKIEEKAKKSKKQTKNNEITITNKMSIEQVFDVDIDKLLDIIKKLDTLYTKHENYEYKSVYNTDCLLSNSFVHMSRDNQNQTPTLKDYPLSEVWEEFYKKEIKDFKTLYNLYMLTNIERGYYYSNLDTSITPSNIVGFKVDLLEKKIKKENLKYFKDSYASRQGYHVINVLYSEYKKENRAFIYNASKSVILSIYKDFEANKFCLNNKKNWNNYITCETIFDIYDFMRNILSGFELFESDDEFKEYFAINYYMYKEFYNFAKKENAKMDKIFLGIIDYAKAVQLGLIQKDEFYIEVLNRGDTVNWIRTISSYIEGTLPDKKVKGYNNAINDETIAFIKEEGQKIIDYMVSIELNRGDSPTKYSDAIHKIQHIEGVDYLIKILKALGNLKLDRNSWYFSGGDTKPAVLSHLLKVCYPSKDDNAKKLKSALKDTDITTLRLIEVAMYSSQWIDILEDYLGWSGLASGCYYFQAHMSDVDKKKESLFAKYTPISVEDLSLGAFDVDWFNSAYKELGKDKFDMLYESAKYISDGAKHSRARKFADAVLGNLDIKETEEQIEDKRNKDLVASYALIPLAKAKAKNKDMLRRYKFLQKFLKDSKQFGAQRRASEAKAVEIALDNLSRNAGFSDVTRLIWTAETDIIKELKSYFEPKKVSDITAHIKIDDLGKASIVYEKDGKKLKSLPSKLKKDAYIEELKEVQKNLKDQYSRSKKMLEESMEDAVEFFVYEIENIMQNNNVIMPLIKDLVFKVNDDLGFYKDKKLLTIDGKKISLKDNDAITIAHALDLYNSKDWAKYQKYLFDNQIKQAFKQVFRELYVKTEDEMGRDTTLRYSGHQVQPAKTVALLKSRRWVVDGEEGLQKVYYKQNIIAKIYALADWFSPADIEAPTLEWVEFYDRKTFKKLLIDDIPDLIFTEVMRDVDLAVSVAHVGGVDPETSHSTIQMRKAIVEFNLPLFKLTNVSFTDKHAIIKGSLAEYSVHLGSGLVHQKAGSVINVLPVHSQHRGKLFLPFIDEDPKTAEIMSKILLFAEDNKIKDPSILDQITK